MKRTEIEIGNIVICDICNSDYTNSTKTGGFVWSARAVCPKCQKDLLKKIKTWKEEKYIEAYCPENMSFAQFIIKYRGKNSKIIVTVFKRRSNMDKKLQEALEKSGATVIPGFTVTFRSQEEVDAARQRIDEAVKQIKKITK